MNSRLVQKVIGATPSLDDLITAIASVLEEGSPELRVALLLVDRGLSEAQVGEFLRSMPELPSSFTTTVYNTVRDIERGSRRQDTYTEIAAALKRRQRRQRRTGS